MAGIGAAYAGGVTEFPNAAGVRIGVDVSQMICGCGQIVDVGDRTLAFVVSPPVILERETTYSVPILAISQTLRKLKQGQFALPADDGVNKIWHERLFRNQAGVPSAEHNGEIWAEFLDCLSNADGSPDHGTSQQRDTQAKRIFSFAQDGRFEVRRGDVINQLDVKSTSQQRRCQGQEAQWCAQWRTVVRRIEQYDLILHGQLACVAGSRRFASTAGLGTTLSLFSRSFTQSSTGKA